jgi:hypothetical protein
MIFLINYLRSPVYPSLLLHNIIFIDWSTNILINIRCQKKDKFHTHRLDTINKIYLNLCSNSNDCSI